MKSLPEFVGGMSVLLLFAALLFPYFGSLVWVYRDAAFRGKAPGLVVLLVAVIAWPVSLLFWLVMRPEPDLWGRRSGR